MRKTLTDLLKSFTGTNYIHIPKWFWLRNLLKKVLIVERTRGRGRNWKAIGEQERHLTFNYPADYQYGRFTRALGYDGQVPFKYASYLYLKLK